MYQEKLHDVPLSGDSTPLPQAGPVDRRAPSSVRSTTGSVRMFNSRKPADSADLRPDTFTWFAAVRVAKKEASRDGLMGHPRLTAWGASAGNAVVDTQQTILW